MDAIRGNINPAGHDVLRVIYQDGTVKVWTAHETKEWLKHNLRPNRHDFLDVVCMQSLPCAGV